MIEEREITVGKMVARDYRKAEVFKRFGIDFCCGGGVTLEAACSAYKADIEEVKKALLEVDLQQAEPDHDFESWNLADLADYIVEKHHGYVVKSVPVISQFVNKVKMVHGENKPNVTEIADNFNDIAAELDAHMKKEEMILFPFIKQLAEAESTRQRIEVPFGTVANPISMMEHEHDYVGDKIKLIEKLTENYNPPKGACATHTVSYQQLQEFANDLMQHIHLENNILFPRAIALEKKLNG